MESWGKKNENVKEEKNEATKDKSIDSKPKPEEIFSVQLFYEFLNKEKIQKEENLNGYLQFCDSKYYN